MTLRTVTTPLNDAAVRGLRAGDHVLLSGVILQARDAAHKRLVALISKGEPLPFDVRGAVVYYMGPSPARPGRIIGSAGPTTSGRMDAYTPVLLDRGLKGMIGKGARDQTVKEALREHCAVYLAATGGAGALLATHVLSHTIIAYPELGAEAIARLEVAEFPVVVVNDCYGGDLYEQGRDMYRRAR